MASPLPTETAPAPQPRGAGDEPQAMSAEELKAHLFRSLQAKGVLAQLKSQLRCRLVQELRRSANGGGESPAPGATPTFSLALQVANSIVAEHLRGCGYEYSLSTFLPESHTSLDKLLSRDDVMHYLQLEPSSPLHTALTEDTGRGFLRDFIESLSSAKVGGATCSHTHSMAVQTEGGGASEPLSLTARLQALDESHAVRVGEEVGGRGGSEGVGEMVEGWKRECEEEMRRQMNREMEQFREHELSQAREEERVRCEAELRNLRIEQEDKHQKKMGSVRKLELDTLDRLRRKEQEAEAALHAKRQELQQQIQAVGVREEQLHREAEMNRQTVGVAEQRVAMALEQIAAREREVVRYREQQEAALEERAQRYHQECKLQLETKQAELTRWEGQLRAGHAQQAAVQTELQRAREQVTEERARREGVEGSLHEATRHLVELQRQKENTQQAMEKMSDYGQLRQQLSELRAHVAKTERKLSENRAEHRRMQAELQETIRGLRRQLGRPNKDQLRILEEAEQVKRECQLRLTEAEEEKRMLRRELSVQAGLGAQLQSQLQEQTLGLRETEREVADLTAQLNHFQTALLHTGQGGRLHSKKPTSSQSPRLQHTSHLPSHPSSPSPRPPISTHNTSLADPSSRMLLETRATFVRLEEEAAELEKHYQHFHQRLATGSLPPGLDPPSPPLSPTLHLLTNPLLPPASYPAVVTTLPPTLLPGCGSLSTQHTSSSPLWSYPATSCTSQTTSSTATRPLATTTALSSSVTTLTSTGLSRPPAAVCSTSTLSAAGVVRSSETTRLTVASTAAPAVTYLTSATRTIPSVASDASRQTLSPQPLTTSSLPSPVSLPLTSPTSLPLTSPTSLPSGPLASAEQPLPTQLQSVPCLPQPTQPQPPRLLLDQLWKQPEPASTSAGSLGMPYSGSSGKDLTPLSRPLEAVTVRTSTELASAVSSTREKPASSSKPPPEPVPLRSSPTGSREEECVPTGCREDRTQDRVPSDSLHQAPLMASPTSSVTVSTSDNVTAAETTPSTEGAERKEDGGEGLDPLMLKYMELVKQKRAEEREKGRGSQPSPRAEDHSNSRHSQQEFGLPPPLSQTTDSFGGFSEPEQGDDPFQDW